MSLTEFQLHKQAAEYFRTVLAPEVLWWHTPNNPKSAKHGAWLKQMGALAGVPDFLIIWPNVNQRVNVLGIEMKTPTGKQSASQREFECAFNFAGAHYAVCRGIGGIQFTLARHGVPTRGKLAA